MMKRLFDIMLAAIGIIVFLPFGLVIAVILLLTGEGDVFYRQPRVGLGGGLFNVVKFVTMVKNSPNLGSGLLTIKDDPRILPFGRFLRNTKLNEVPQLWNILVGQMSFIGPRPQAEPHFRLYSPEVQRELVKVKPGLSGIGSIVFRNEENMLSAGSAQSAALYAEKISAYKGELEMWYVRKQSFSLDILLILLTLWVVAFSRSRIYRRMLRDLPEPPMEEFT